ncbi:hypothetical protein TYRP_004813 [Tyrophagus putrescentiae]|nr:hypothetical protein TYRP_004813 [Tyrophagus putrescentiae]
MTADIFNITLSSTSTTFNTNRPVGQILMAQLEQYSFTFAIKLYVYTSDMLMTGGISATLIR